MVHAGAIGVHAEHPYAARAFVLLALLQTSVGLAALAWKSRSRSTALTCLGVNVASVVGWGLTRTVGIGWIDGLGAPESPQAADTLCAVLALLAALAATATLAGKWIAPRATQTGLVTAAVAVLTAPALWTGATHVHAHDDSPRESSLEITSDGVIVTNLPSTTPQADPALPGAHSVPPADSASSSAGLDPTRAATSTVAPRVTAPNVTVTAPAATTTVPQITHTHSTTPEQRLAAQSGWPRPFDPAAGPSFDGIAGVTDAQFQRARTLITAAATDLIRYSTTAVAQSDGYRSIGDGITGYEHWIKWSLIDDGRVLDTKAPESLVYRVTAQGRTLVSAMFIARPGTDINDSTLVEYAGPLMQWHIHDNLCWLNGRVVGVTNSAGQCLIGSPDGVQSPMVHVWITSHPCGPFAAVEGVAAGTAQASDSERLDLCNNH
ncbi:MAG: hypothetical protein ACKO1X_08085 [Acidimicrobiales bacterium]